MRVCTCHKEQIIISRTNPFLIVSVVIMYKSKMNSPPPSPILNNLENGGRKQIINNNVGYADGIGTVWAPKNWQTSQSLVLVT